MNNKKFTLFFDLHGVIVNSEVMIANYKSILVEIYKKYDISEDQSIKYHNSGLKLYLNLISKIKELNLIKEDFILAMSNADLEWDNLMQNFVINSRALELESRNIEYLAGQVKNALYRDAEEVLKYLTGYFIASNSHSTHIKGLLEGAEISSLSDYFILGWDKMKSFKNTDYYFEKLKNYSITNENIMIGNSDEELYYAQRNGFKTILIKREYKVDERFIIEPDLILNNLKNIISEINFIF